MLEEKIEKNYFFKYLTKAKIYKNKDTNKKDISKKKLSLMDLAAKSAAVPNKNKCNGLKSLNILFKKRIYKFCFIKYLQIINSFANTNIFYRYLKLVRNSNYNAAFCSTI